MIQASEIRVGNYINDMFDGMITVRGLTDKGIWIRGDGFPASENAFTGIPLTEQWLLEFGAINKYGCTYYIGKLKFTYEINELSQFVRFYYSGKVAYLQYVHQLQNLYHALTGQELTI